MAIDEEEVIENEIKASALENANSVLYDVTLGRKEKRIGTTYYNMDVTPPQNPALRMNFTDPSDPMHREEIIKYSAFIQKNLKELIDDIFKLGWDYDGDISDIEWSDDLQDQIKVCFFKGLTINCAIFTIWKNGSFRVFTGNDVFGGRRGLTIDDNRNITEVRVNIPSWSSCAGSNEAKKYQTKKFITQFSKEKANCIFFVPVPDIKDPFGLCYSQIQIQSALEKIYLRDTELVFLHNGGVEKSGIIPASTDPIAKASILRDLSRGIRSGGHIIEIESRSGIKTTDVASFAMQALPNVDFATVNDHIDSDASVSKQKMQGAAPTGALGGSAPESNERYDKKAIERIQKILAKLIRYVNEVVFGIPAYTYKEKNGFKIPYATYEIKFKEEIANSDSQGKIDDIQGDNGDNIDNQNNSDKKLQDQNQDQINNGIFIEDFGNGIILENSINDEFVEFEGNMFEAGVYGYPEKGINKFITPEMILEYSKRDIAGRSAYLELDHSDDYFGVLGDEGIGYLETVGYENGKDRTKFYIRKDIYDNHIKSKKIKVSPKFLLKQSPSGESIVLLNCAVMNRQKPRSEAYGLKSEAIMKNGD